MPSTVPIHRRCAPIRQPVRARVAAGWSALAALLLCGCGDEGSAQATRTLRVANWLHAAVDPSFLALEHALEQEYEQANPGWRLLLEPIPGAGQYAPKLVLMHVAGNPPDAGYLDLSAGAVFIRRGVVRDISRWVQTDDEFRLDDYFPQVASSFQRDGRVFGVPLDFTPMVIFYNRRLFDEAGEPYPEDGWTWEQFAATARRMTLRDADPRAPARQFGLHFENVMSFWILWLWSNGGDVLTPDGARAGGALDGPRSVDAIDFLLRLMFDDRSLPTPRESASLGLDLFRAGRAAMDLKGHWMLIDYRSAGLDVGVVSVPTNIGRPVTVLYQSGLCAFERGSNADAAWRWIRFMTSAPVQVRRVASGIAISANRHAAAHYADDPIEQAFLRQVEFGRQPWGATVERYPLVEEIGSEMMRSILNAVAKAPDAAARRAIVERETAAAARHIDAILD